ncbi:MAG TPA: FAD-binding oxidoreductase, partial [Candidatus Scatomorpha pullistercoris]|nr:FAD-binding oxidoreductase [Candidatus Scatomorpha pullistercoris]
MNTELMESLRSILGDKYVLEGEAVGADYGHDELAGGVAHMPAAVVQAGSTEEVSAVLRLCSAAG